MAKVNHVGHLQDREKEFIKLFDKLTYSRSAWQAWGDLMTVMACSIGNAVDRTPDKFQRREEQYERSIKNLGGVEIPAQMLGIITMALEQNPDQDFLGKLYMSLNLGNHWKGQFFTPYNVCRMMAEMNFDDGVQAEVERKGYISVCDPCVGAGAMLIAAANAMRRAKINYQTNAVFVGQDIDRIVAMMAYIQISLIGCPGYIIIGNSLTNPSTGHVLFPRDMEGQEVWITPLFMHDIWEMRRTKELLLGLFGGTVTTEKTVEKEHFFVFYDTKRRSAMKDNGHNGNGIPEQNKEALQSETWQDARKVMKTEIQHFTETPEFRHFAAVKVSKNDNAYGAAWGNVVREYLKTAYSGENAQADVISDGIAYKVLNRGEVTAFYDADGNTLFDVENKRLEKEYGYVMEEILKAGQTGSADKGQEAAEGETRFYSSGEGKLTAEEDEMIASVRPEFKEAMKAQMDLVFQELISWTKQDPEFEKKVLLAHKSMKRCMKFCADRAMGLREPSDQEKADARSNNIPIVSPVGSDMLFGWIKEYYDKDDKAEVEKEKKAAAAQKKSADKKKTADRKKAAPKGNSPKLQEKKPKEKKEDTAVPPKKRDRSLSGQISMFDLLEA